MDALFGSTKAEGCESRREGGFFVLGRLSHLADTDIFETLLRQRRFLQVRRSLPTSRARGRRRERRKGTGNIQNKT